MKILDKCDPTVIPTVILTDLWDEVRAELGGVCEACVTSQLEARGYVVESVHRLQYQTNACWGLEFPTINDIDVARVQEALWRREIQDVLDDICDVYYRGACSCASKVVRVTEEEEEEEGTNG